MFRAAAALAAAGVLPASAGRAAAALSAETLAELAPGLSPFDRANAVRAAANARASARDVRLCKAEALAAVPKSWSRVFRAEAAAQIREARQDWEDAAGADAIDDLLSGRLGDVILRELERVALRRHGQKSVDALAGYDPGGDDVSEF